MNDRLWEDFKIFARAEVASGDLDPIYPVLRRAYANAKLDPERALWRSLLLLTWYHVGSAEKVWRAHPKPSAIDSVKFASLAVGVERRSFKGVGGNAQARAFIAAVLEKSKKSLARWVASFGTGEVGWRSARRELESIAGAGPWASCKWAELLVHVHGLELVAPELSTSAVAGPVPVLAALVDKTPKEIVGSAAYQLEVLDQLRAQGVPLGGLDQLRVCLANFAAMLKGHYYVGHDIDLQMTDLDGAGPELWLARDVFADAYRGERHDQPWSGVRRDLAKAYALRGEIVNVWV